MSFQYVLDFPNTKQPSKNQMFLYIQRWIASDERIENIQNNSKKNINLKEYPRPDVVSTLSKKFIAGFKHLLNPDDIVHLPNNPRILFETGGKKGEIIITPSIIEIYKKTAPKNVALINKIKSLKQKRIKPYLICPICK